MEIADGNQYLSSIAVVCSDDEDIPGQPPGKKEMKRNHWRHGDCGKMGYRAGMVNCKVPDLNQLSWKQQEKKELEKKKK